MDNRQISRSTPNTYRFHAVVNLWISSAKGVWLPDQDRSTHNKNLNIHSYPQVTPSLGATINFLFSFKAGLLPVYYEMPELTVFRLTLNPVRKLGDLVIDRPALGHQLADLSVGVHNRGVVATAEGLANLRQ